jgi:hypothetical protein
LTPLGATRTANPMQRWSDIRYGASAGRKASIERCVSETVPRVRPEPEAIFLPLFCSVRRNAVATELAALGEPA